MTDRFSREAQEIFNAAKHAKIPENVKTVAQDGVAKSREAFELMQSVSKDGVQTMETVLLTAQAGARTMGERMLRNIEVNAGAAFDAAEAMARAQTVPEFVQLQADFVQAQLNLTSDQAKDLFDLSARIAQQTFEAMSAASMRAFGQLKKSG
jgi:hypothetical protein